MMNRDNLAVLTNIIGAVETGGQVYGKRRYDDYTGPYTNTAGEHTVTLGWAQHYGDEARQLVKKIFEMDMAGFRKLDACHPSIEGMLQKDWVGIKWNPSAEQRKVLVRIIDSEAGHKAQDELFAELMERFVADCEKDYTADVRAQMMYCEIRHLGGKGAADRVFKRCRGDYGLDRIMEALRADQDDARSNNQVGDKVFWSRHLKCREFVEKYAVVECAAAGPVEIGEKGIKMTALQRAKVLLRQPLNDVMTGYTPDGKQGFVDAGAWVKKPKKGDVIYFYSTAKGRVGHVGIVESVDEAEEVVHTVEGNTSSAGYAENGGCVARHSYSYAAQGGTNRVNGFGRPDFAGAGVTAEQFVATAVAYIGYLEKQSNKNLESKTANAGSNNFQRFQRDVGAGNGDQWCQYFVDAVALYTCQRGSDGKNDNAGSAGQSDSSGAGKTLNENMKWTGVVTAEWLCVRTWAGKENPEVSFSPLKGGSEVGICDELKADDGSKWYYVLFGGKHGFVSGKYVEKKGGGGNGPDGGGSSDEKATVKLKKLSAAEVMTAAVKNVADAARKEKWVYGDSRNKVPCTDKRISCDRLIARALWDMGFRDQRVGGETCGSLDRYLTEHGWKKVLRKSGIKDGAVVAVKTKGNTYIDHVFYVAQYNKANDVCNKYDTGSDARIRTKQPFKKVKLVEWENREFVCAWNCPEWLGSGTPGRFVRNGVDYGPVFNDEYYRRMNPDVEKVFGKDRERLFGHFWEYGMNEGRIGCAGFDVKAYKKRIEELKLGELKLGELKLGELKLGELREYYRWYCEHK